jgi:hypothetical protein
MFFSTPKSFGCRLWQSKVGDQKQIVVDYSDQKLTTDLF